MTDMPTKNTVIFVLDRSGSMENKLEATLESFNGYLEELRQSPAEIEFTLMQFDTISTDVIHRRKPLKDVGKLTREIYKPRGGTPLIDAACIAIEAAKQDYQPTDKVLITIMTDGLENSSQGFTMADLHAKIKEASGWGWQFIFLGASIDNYEAGSKMGLRPASTMSYDASRLHSTKAAYAATANATRDFFATGEAVSFSDQDKQAAGDAYADKNKAPEVKSYSNKGKTLVDKIKL